MTTTPSKHTRPSSASHDIEAGKAQTVSPDKPEVDRTNPWQLPSIHQWQVESNKNPDDFD